MKRVSIFAIIALLCSLCRADVIILNDGTRIEGDLRRTETGWTITTRDGKIRTMVADAVKSVEIGRSPATQSSLNAQSALASLRRASEALSDINQIIARYQLLIHTTKDEKTLADAKADLDMWQLRKQQGQIKYGSRWMSTDEVKTLSVQGNVFAEAASNLLRQNKVRDAEQTIQQALTIDPRNSGALYLRGVLTYRQEKLADARKVFETVNGLVPGHAPTLNNLAVILWRQNAQAPALSYYDQAMQAAGVNQYILDNVAEALGSMPEEQRKGPLIAKAMRRFTDLDRLLQQQRAQEGFYRWGGTWVDQKGMDELKVAEKIFRDKLQTLQADFDQLKARVVEIDAQINSNTQAMQEMERNHRTFRDKDGNLIIFPLPDSYYQIKTENQRLAIEQENLRNKMPLMQEQAQAYQRQAPMPRFTGVQQIVGAEGMPGPQDIAAAPATTPVAE